jgi:hypothetical protein
MKDHLKMLQEEIVGLEVLKQKQWLDVLQETNETLTNTWLNKLLSHSKNEITCESTPLKIVVKELADCVLEQTPLGKSENKWAVLLNASIELILPEVIDRLINKKKV